MDSSPNPNKAAYGYDALGHLTSDTRTGSYAYAKSYSVDGAGNRLSMNGNGAVTTLTEDADDELNSASGTGSYGYTYNANGDQITSTAGAVTTNFGYDYDDQLVSLSKPGSTTTYAYDALGRQTARTVNGVWTQSFYDGGQVLFELGASGETAAYTWGNDLARRNGEVGLSDGRGNERQTADGSQAVVSSSVTTAFGNTLSTTGSTSSPYGFGSGSGYRSDGDLPAGLAPLMKVGARYYDAQMGRFITRDTDLSQPAYAYCDGDPVNLDDPSGHLPMQNIPQPNDGPGGPSFDGSGAGESDGSDSGDGGGDSGDGGGDGLGGGAGGTDPGGPVGGSGGSTSQPGPVAIPVGNGSTLTYTPGANGSSNLTIGDGTAGITGNFGNNGDLKSVGANANVPLGGGFFFMFSGTVPLGTGNASGMYGIGWSNNPSGH